MSAKECSVDGCGKRLFARGWCAAHYQRWRRGSSASGPLRARTELEHGTTSMYSGRKCRCPACREAWRVYYKEYRARKKAGVGV